MNVLITWLALVGEPGAELSCGGACVYIMSAMVDRPPSVAAIAERMPAGSPASLAEIINAFEANGVPVAAWDARSQERLPDTVCVAHFHRGEPGHFIVLQPVDAVGRQFRWIDAPRLPSIVEERRVLDDPEFSGWVVAHAPWLPYQRFISRALVLGGVLLIVIRCWRWRRELHVIIQKSSALMRRLCHGSARDAVAGAGPSVNSTLS